MTEDTQPMARVSAKGTDGVRRSVLVPIRTRAGWAHPDVDMMEAVAAFREAGYLPGLTVNGVVTLTEMEVGPVNTEPISPVGPTPGSWMAPRRPLHLVPPTDTEPSAA